MPFDRDAFLREAIQTPSHEDVTAMRELLVETLVEEGHDPEVDEAGNVLASRGTAVGGEPHFVLNTHVDTVPPHIEYQREGDVVRGRGACDAKGQLTALLDAFLSASIGDGRLTLAVTPDEETAQFGGANLGETLDADGYIVGEPTGLDVCHAARGAFGGRVTLYGESAHVSDPDGGINPLCGVGPLVEALERYDERCGPSEHEVLCGPTLTPTLVEADGPLNQIPAECTVSFDRRTVPPETIDEFVGRLESYLDEWLPEAYDFEVGVAFRDSPDPDAFVTDPDADLVRTLAEVSGGDIRPFGATSDASYLAENGPTTVFGPGVLADEDGPVAHADREYVSLGDVEAAADAVRVTVETLLG